MTERATKQWPGGATPPAATQFERLFSPLDVGPMRVPNRICETTNTIGAAQMPGFIDDAFIAHHVAKARGGTGWIGSETFLIDSPMPAAAADEFFPGGGTLRIPIYELSAFTENLARFCEAVHEAGAVVVCQLTQLNFTMAASSLPLVEPYDWIPHALEKGEIERILASYARAAARFGEAGVDGLEIHCAHETIPHSFLSPAMNERSDEYGGDVRGRTLFVRRLLEGVREAIGNTLALGIRLNGEETREGGYGLLEMREMASCIAETGTLDFVNVDVGHCWGSPSYVQPSYYGHGVYREVGKALKVDLEGVAILFSGRANDPGIAECLLAENCCDLVGMTRAGIADPEFANKAREGRLAEIRRCIGCNRCIAQAIHNDAPDVFKKPTCSVNPEIGDEIFWATQSPRAKTPRRLVVVGGGVAGCETARVAARRGHDVILLERGQTLGGQLRLAARAPGRDAFEDLMLFQQGELSRYGVDVRLGVEGDVEAILAERPDAIACATGSRPRAPRGLDLDADFAVQGWDVLAGRARLGERIALVSQEDHFETPNVADYLLEHGHRVEIFHKWTGIGSEIDRYSLGPIMSRLIERGVAIHPGLRLAAAGAGKLEFRSVFGGGTRHFEGFDALVLVYGSQPDVRLYRGLREAGVSQQLFLVGSAWAPRGLAEATKHGARVALEVG